MTPSAMSFEVSTSTCVVRARPNGTPMVEPMARPSATLRLASRQPPRIMKSEAVISSHQQTGISCTGGRIKAPDAMTMAESAKPEKPRTSPARKQIRPSKAR
jgi:hypothetical protein